MVELAEVFLHEMSPPPVDMNGEEILVIEGACAWVGKILAIYDKAKRRFGMRVDWLEEAKVCGLPTAACAHHCLNLTSEQIGRIELNPGEGPLYLLSL
jgi:hypothetical protein